MRWYSRQYSPSSCLGMSCPAALRMESIRTSSHSPSDWPRGNSSLWPLSSSAHFSSAWTSASKKLLKSMGRTQWLPTETLPFFSYSSRRGLRITIPNRRHSRVNMVAVEGENGIAKFVPDKLEKTRGQCWCNLKQQKGKDLMEYVDSEKHFSFCPYGYTP